MPMVAGISLPVLLSQTNFIIIACRGFEFAPLVSTILIFFRLCQLARDIHKFPVERWCLQTLMRVGMPLLALPIYFWLMYRQMHLMISLADLCPYTTRHYLLPLYSLILAFFIHTYPVENLVPEMFGVPTTLPCTAPHKRELARLMALRADAAEEAARKAAEEAENENDADDENENRRKKINWTHNNVNNNNDSLRADVSESRIIGHCKFCELNVRAAESCESSCGCRFAYEDFPFPSRTPLPPPPPPQR